MSETQAFEYVYLFLKKHNNHISEKWLLEKYIFLNISKPAYLVFYKDMKSRVSNSLRIQELWDDLGDDEKLFYEKKSKSS